MFRSSVRFIVLKEFSKGKASSYKNEASIGIFIL
jgi:hypothetical protein